MRRASQKPGAVSPGLEQGWLAFASGEQKRRLAPFPAEWESTSDTKLEELCVSARIAPPPRYPLDRPVRPRIKRQSENPTAAGVAPPASSDVEVTVRDFAHEARSRGLPAVTAMLELKTFLQREHPAPDSEARNRQSVRRWFVEAYYFEHRKG